MAKPICANLNAKLNEFRMTKHASFGRENPIVYTKLFKNDVNSNINLLPS